MKYQYVGTGQGVPGLPNEVTDKQAKELGLAKVLEECLKAGLYKEVKGKPKGVKSDG